MVSGGGDDRVQVLLSYYAKCHETPFCMRDRLGIDGRKSRGKKDEKDDKKKKKNGEDLEFII